MLRMRIDKAQARKVFAQILAQYQARQHPFLSLESDRPQHHVPEALREQPMMLARFLFYLCLYMRGGIDSVHATKQLALVQAEHPWLFTEAVLEKTEVEITAAIATYIALFRQRIGRFWLHNARVLWSRFGGDPRRIFEGAKTVTITTTARCVCVIPGVVSLESRASNYCRCLTELNRIEVF